MKRLASHVIVLGALCIPALPCAADPATPLYTIAKTVALGSPERWDLLVFDGSADRVYIAHGDRVTIVDERSGTVAGNVEGFPGGTHGVAIVTTLGVGYSDDGKAGTTAPFDLKTLKIGRATKAAADADAVVFDPVSGHVFVIDGDPGKMTVINPETNAAVATIDGGGKLEIGAADRAGHLFVNGEANREVLRIDTRTNAVTGKWPIGTCASPHGLAIDSDAHRLFVSCENNLLVVVDADDGKLVAAVPIGGRTDGAAFDPIRKRVFSSNGDGTLTVIAERSPDAYEVLGTIETKLGARTMTIDPRSGRLFLVAADIKVDPSAPPNDFRKRYQIVPGSVELLILDPSS